MLPADGRDEIFSRMGKWVKPHGLSLVHYSSHTLLGEQDFPHTSKARFSAYTPENEHLQSQN